MALWPARYGAEHPVDVRFAPTEAERRHKSGASASRYANIGQDCGVLCASGTRLAPTEVATEMWGAACQWHARSLRFCLADGCPGSGTAPGCLSGNLPSDFLHN